MLYSPHIISSKEDQPHLSSLGRQNSWPLHAITDRISRNYERSSQNIVQTKFIHERCQVWCYFIESFQSPLRKLTVSTFSGWTNSNLKSSKGLVEVMESWLPGQGSVPSLPAAALCISEVWKCEADCFLLTLNFNCFSVKEPNGNKLAVPMKMWWLLTIMTIYWYSFFLMKFHVINIMHKQCAHTYTYVHTQPFKPHIFHVK